MLSDEITVIAKVTNACDMRCRYCFIEPSIMHKTMPLETAQTLVRAFLTAGCFKTVHFVWHGGEPLLRGRDFFVRVLDAQAACQSDTCYTNATQTNATRLDDAMLDFLIANRIHIGLSLDGPQRLNDCSRKMSGEHGQSAYQVTRRAVRRLQARGFQPAAIVVVNRNNVAEPEAIYDEFKRLGIHMKLNSLTRSGRAAAGPDDLGISAEAYGTFLVRLFDLWFDDPAPTITIQPFEQHVARILGSTVAPSCYFARHCHHHFIGVSPEGELFPCGMFQGEPAFRYGSLFELKIQDIARTQLFEQLERREKMVLRQCAPCAFFDLCYGGCLFHALKDAGEQNNKDFYCQAYRMYFENALRRIHADLTDCSQNRSV